MQPIMDSQLRDFAPMRRLYEVMDGNLTRNRLARQLNTRAGEAIFPVMDRASLAVWLANRLQGARRGAEVQNPDALRLPELNEAEVARVLSECPDTITVLGVELPVEYRDGAAPPRVALTDEMVSANQWNGLPASGVATPGGRPVEVAVRISHWNSISEIDVPQLKARMRDHRNQETWDGWEKPELALPDMADPAATIPEIIEHVYGRCVVTGVELVAYGVVRYNSGRYYSNDPYFKGEWTRDRAEAEVKRAEAVNKLEGLRKELREKGAVEAAKADAQTAKSELQDIKSREGWWELDSGLRQRVDERSGYYSSIPSDLDGIQAWIIETRALKAEVETALAGLAERKAAEERERLAAEEAERRDLKVILPIVNDDLYTARAVLEFAQAVEVAKGAVKGAKILRREFEAPYGRARRQSVLAEAIPSLRDSADASQILSFGKASTVDLYLEAAIAWLEAKVRASQPKPASVAKPAEPVATAPEVSTSGGLNLGALANAWGSKVRR